MTIEGMLLVIDVGNTNIGFGLFEGDKLVHQFRCESARQRTSDEYAVFIRQMLLLKDVEHRKIEAGIIASVVPPLTDVMVDMVRRAFAREPLVVGPKIRSGMAILYENPREVGADRIVNAVAAFDQVKGGVIVVDFGTATTFDCVSDKGEYLGGVIAPGIQISADALFSRAAKLHRVEIAKPARVVGRNPVQSMQAGIVFGYAGLVDGVVTRIKAELGYPCAVIGTGGLAGLIAPQTTSIERVDDALTLHGLRLLYERNADG
jgi:type III pantothenate kinase